MSAITTYRRIDTEPIPIYIWGDVAEDGTMEQARHLANLPFAFHHVALMADAHVGYGMPIGGVLATESQVIPHAVGLDIGCGMVAWPTNVPTSKMLLVRDEILHDVQRSVPTGFQWHRTSQATLTEVFDSMPQVPVLLAERDKAMMQIGSLGGGNHFIELQADEDDMTWAMVHSGSRNVGKQMGEYYDRLARKVNQASLVPPEWGLAHFEIDSGSGAEYLAVMTWCLDFAAENRRLMADAFRSAVARRFPDVDPGEPIAIHHNYAAREKHFGRDVIVHRKGAVHACGRVIVPGSMGSSSYIGDGLANPDSFESCSHGAGRAMGRKEAVRLLERQQVMAGLAEKDVHLFKVKKGDVAEEAPQAYKDIEDVMANQADLVRPLVKLRPLGVVKG